MHANAVVFLGSFRLVRPRYEARQEEILAWLAETHAAGARASAPNPATFDAAACTERMKRLVRHVCCGPDKIAARGYSTADAKHAREDETVLYDVARSPAGGGTAARTDHYAREVESVFSRLYAEEAQPPDDLIHVTCTGYVSPSGAQRLVSKKGWGTRTRVTHAYHMGCYAAVPALRMGTGFVRSHKADDVHRVDIVHTELCSLHFDPSDHSPEQFVVQSLFGDGSIRYTLRGDLQAKDGAGLRVLALHEVVADDSEDAMQWRMGDHGIRMKLSRAVPERIGHMIREFSAALFDRADLDFARERADCVFAVHPGGPKIIDVVRDALEVRDAQVAAAHRVLRKFGNMSSATLPHIWLDLLGDPECRPGSLIASFAFGPGLTVAGALFRKE